jgi:hypothetical protein
MTQQYPQMPPPKRKRRIWPWLLIAIFIVIAIAAVNSGSHDSAKPAGPTMNPAASPTAPATTIPPLTAAPNTRSGHTIIYEVISDAATLNNVTYFDANSAEQQETSPSAPWSKTVVNTSTYAIAGIAAQTNGQSVTCRITVDGKVSDTKTSTGQYAVVNCNAAIR